MTSALAFLARRQHGVFTVDQALQCGVSLRSMRRRLARGEWEAVHQGVLVAASTRRTFAVRAMAALLALPGVVALGGRAGAYALGLAGFDEPEVIEVVTEAGGHRPRLAGVVVRQRSGLSRRDVRAVDGLAVLERHLLVADLGRLITKAHLLTVVQDELFHERLSPRRLSLARRRGRAGSRRLGEVLAVIAAHHATLTEQEGVRLLRAVGICDVEPNKAPYEGMREADALVRAAQLGIDFQGGIHRVSRRKQNADSDKVTEWAGRDHLLLTPTNDTIWLKGEQWAREVKAIVDERRARYAA